MSSKSAAVWPMIRRRMSLVSGAVVLSVFVVASARAQEQHKVMVVLTGPVTTTGCSSVPREVSLVIDDKDGREDRFTLTRSSACRWTGGPFPLDYRSHFSLRLGIARTDCERPTLLDNVAWVAFECCRATAVRQVKVHTEFPGALSYIRQVPPSHEGAASVPCIEHSAFPAGDGPVDDVDIDKEWVRLQFGRSQADVNNSGLLVNRLFAAGTKRPKEGLSLDGVVDALAIQRASGDASAPTFSSNAYDFDRKSLQNLRLNTLVVKELMVRP